MPIPFKPGDPYREMAERAHHRNWTELAEGLRRAANVIDSQSRHIEELQRQNLRLMRALHATMVPED